MVPASRWLDASSRSSRLLGTRAKAASATCEAQGYRPAMANLMQWLSCASKAGQQEKGGTRAFSPPLSAPAWEPLGVRGTLMSALHKCQCQGERHALWLGATATRQACVAGTH